jgi:nucleotide-binding universal stress UspA family protein
MKIERVLVATDFSPAGHRAAQAAAAWSHREQSALRLIHVIPPKSWLSGLSTSEDAANELAQRNTAIALRALADAIDPARRLEISTGVHSGRASLEILRAALEFDCDLLVIGAHGEREPQARQRSLGARRESCWRALKLRYCWCGGPWMKRHGLCLRVSIYRRLRHTS